MNPVAAAGRGTRWLRFGRRCAHGKINRLTLQKRSTVWCSFFRALLVRHSRRFEHESRGRRHWDKWHHKAVAVRWGSILAREALLKHRWGEAEWRERRSEPLTAALSPTAGSASRRSPAKSPRGPCRTFCHLKKRKIRCVDRAEKVKRKKLKVISVAPPQYIYSSIIPLTSRTMPGNVRLVMRPLIWVVQVWRGCRVSDHNTALAPGSTLPITWRLIVWDSYGEHMQKERLDQLRVDAVGRLEKC